MAYGNAVRRETNAGIHLFHKETAESDNLENRVGDVNVRLQWEKRTELLGREMD